MKILVRALLWGFGLLLVAMVALAVFLPFYFDPNDYKDQIAKKVKEDYGRDLALNGDISLSVFPWLGMEVNDASLSNAPGFGNEPFAAIKSAEVRVKLLPLLRRQVEVGDIVLDGVALRLQKNAVGQDNWSDMLEHKKKESETDRDEDKPSEFKIESFEVAAVEIKDSTVLWHNAQTGSRHELKNFNFSTGRLRAGASVLMKSNFSLVTGKPAVTSQVSLEGKVKADPKKKTYRIDKFELQAVVASEKMPGGKQPISLTGGVDLDLDKQKMVISDLVLEAFTLKVTGQAAGSNILDAPAFAGTIKAAGINPRAVMKAMGKDEPQTTDSSVLKSASFESTFQATSERASLNPIAIKLDDSSMNGSLSVANFSNPAIAFDLKVDEVDVDRYLAPAEKGKAATSSSSKGDSGEVNVETAKDLNLNGSLSVKKLKIMNLRMDNAVLTLRARDGIMVIEPFTANFYQGRINLAGRMDSRGARPSYKINAQTSSINVEQMLTALNGSSKINGTGNLNLNLTTSGLTSEELKRSSNGTMDFNLNNGEIKGINLGQKLRQAYALYKGERYTGNEPQTTQFSRIQGSAQIHNGVLQNDDFDAKSTPFGLDGAGTANFVAETINYLVKVSVADTAGGELGKGLEGLVGKTIPVRLTGNLYDPKWQLDLAGVAQEKIKEEIKKKTDEAKDKAKQKLMDKLGLGGGAKEPPAPAAGAAAPSGEATTVPSDSSTAPAEAPAAAPAAEPEKQSTKDALKEEALRRLLGGSKDGE